MISPTYDFSDFCDQVSQDDSTGVFQSVNMELDAVSMASQAHGGERIPRPGTTARAYYDDLEIIQHLFLGERLPDTLRQGFIDDSLHVLAALSNELPSLWDLRIRMRANEDAAKRLLASGTDALQVIVPRRDVESNNLENWLPLLYGLLTAQTARQFRDNVSFLIDGYNNDLRELYVVPQVRAFMHTLDQQFPYWFFFLPKHMGNLKFITLALCDLETIVRGGAVAEQNSFEHFLEFHNAMLHQIARYAGFNHSEIAAMQDRVSAYYFGEPHAI